MKEILVNAFSSIAILCIATVMFYSARWFHNKCEQLKQKVDSEALKALIDKIDFIVQLCVEATNQTFVDDLKEQDNFTDESKEQAFAKTFEAIQNMITDEDKEEIIAKFGDMSTFIRTSVEKYIKSSKDIV